jgi:hypothetical protein
MDSTAAALMEAGTGRNKDLGSGLRQARLGPHGRSAHARTAHSVSSSSLRKKSDASLVRKVPVAPLRPLLANLQEVLLGTKLAILFPAVPLAIAAQCAAFGQVRSALSVSNSSSGATLPALMAIVTSSITCCHVRRAWPCLFGLSLFIFQLLA